MFVYQRVLPEEHVHTCIIPWKGSDHYDTVTCGLFSWISNTAPLQTEKHETKTGAKNRIWNPKRIKTTILIFVCFFCSCFFVLLGLLEVRSAIVFIFDLILVFDLLGLWHLLLSSFIAEGLSEYLSFLFWYPDMLYMSCTWYTPQILPYQKLQRVA